MLARANDCSACETTRSGMTAAVIDERTHALSMLSEHSRRNEVVNGHVTRLLLLASQNVHPAYLFTARLDIEGVARAQ